MILYADRKTEDAKRHFLMLAKGRTKWKKKKQFLDQDGKPMFVTDGKLKYLRNKLYRLNLKRECFTLKGMSFNGSVWIKGTKK